MKNFTLALYRVRGVIFYAATGVLVAVVLFGRLFSGAAAELVQLTLIAVGVVGWAICFVLAVAGPKALPQRATVNVHSPVRGRWLALNSPASKTPSHGTHAYGQAYAIDLAFEPEGYTRPEFGSWPAMREATEFKAFRQPVYAMVDGVVVSASDWRRDHRSRSNFWAFGYLMAEGTIRELGGPTFLVGNHVTVRTANGEFATVGHLSQGANAVSVGDTVQAGDLIGLCGNSGNSSEPHVHAQLADRASFWTAQGIPFAFTDITITGITAGSAPVDPADSAGERELTTGLPRNNQHLIKS